MKICAAFRSLDRMIQVICFKHFWMNVSKLVGESMIKNLSQLRTEKFLGLVSVMVLMMTMFVDEINTEASKLSLSGILNLESEADKDPVAGNLEILAVAFSHSYQNPPVYS